MEFLIQASLKYQASGTIVSRSRAEQYARSELQRIVSITEVGVAVLALRLLKNILTGVGTVRSLKARGNFRGKSSAS